MIYLNGKFVLDKDAKLEHNDRSFLLSDGIFETMRSYEGIISNLSDHFERLKKSAVYLGIPFSMTLQELRDATNLLLEHNSLAGKNASLRITLTRGTGPRGLLPPEAVKPTLMITAFTFASNSINPSKVIVSDIRRNEFSPLSNIKSLCYLENILARRDATKKGADDCILLNTRGYVACGSVANVFIVTPRGIITPRLEDGVLPGIARKIVIDLCKSNNMPIYEEAIKETELISSEEVFFTNKLIEIQPVIQVNSKLINGGEIGKVVAVLQIMYKKFIRNHCEGIKEVDAKKKLLPQDKIFEFAGILNETEAETLMKVQTSKQNKDIINGSAIITG